MKLKNQIEIEFHLKNKQFHLTDAVRCALFEDCLSVDLSTGGCCSFLIKYSSNAALVSPIKYKNSNQCQHSI
jgi:hypothetical protein